MSTLVYDIEVVRGPDEVEGGWDNPEAMGFATAVAYEYETDRYHFYEGELGRHRLIKALSGNLVVSFNGIKFDSRVLLGNDRPGTPWVDFDILLEVIRIKYRLDSVGEAEAKLGDKAIHDGSFSLDGLSEGTFGLRKTGHGAKAPQLYRDKQYDELFAYNLHDVRLTRKLFDLIYSFGYVVDRHGWQIKIAAPMKEAPSI